jgi:ABC-type Fe3+ transport system substrate-binding protein
LETHAREALLLVREMDRVSDTNRNAMRLLTPLALALLLPLRLVLAAEVVVYTSLDQVFSEPILQEFEARSGMIVNGNATLRDVVAQGEVPVGFIIDFLLSPEVERRLAFSESMQIPVRPGVERPGHVPPYDSIQAMQVDYRSIADNLETSARFCRRLFTR